MKKSTKKQMCFLKALHIRPGHGTPLCLTRTIEQTIMASVDPLKFKLQNTTRNPFSSTTPKSK